MTNAELDHWFAVNVMRWRIAKGYDARNGIDTSAWIDPDGVPRGRVAAFHPTSAVSQAIEVAEKSRSVGRIGDWCLLSPSQRPGQDQPIAEVSRYLVDVDAKAPTFAEALCRALYEALQPSIAPDSRSP